MIALTAGWVDFSATVVSGVSAAGDACAPVRPSMKAAPNPTPSAVKRSRRPCLDKCPSFNCLVMSPISPLSNRLFAESSLMTCLPDSSNRPTSLTILRLTYNTQVNLPQHVNLRHTQTTILTPTQDTHASSGYSRYSTAGYTFCGDVQMTFRAPRGGVARRGC